jgi:tripartite-type tricarboxylate transporter receptor subunit TctC
MITRRSFNTALATLSAAAAGLPGTARAQMPETLRLLVGFPAGGATDTVARRLADKLRGKLAANVMVENRPGAGAQLAVSALKTFPADGQTLLLSPPAPFLIYPHTYKTLPYAPADVTPVSLVCNFAFAFGVGPAVPASVRNLKEFLDWVKADPARGNFGSPAAGASPHLVGALLALQAGVPLTHVPYRGDAPGLQDLMGGKVPAFSSTLGSFLPHLKGGRLRLLAVSGTARNPFAPEVPTYREQGFPIDITEWFGLFALAATPAATVQRAADAVREATAQPDFVQGLADFGMAARASTPQALATQMRQEAEFWRAEVRRIGFTAES